MAKLSQASASSSYEPARPEDLDELVELRIEAMRESLQKLGRFDASRARLRLAEGFDPSCTWHILLNGERVGFVVVKPRADGWLLDHLYVRPSAQNRGVGAAVLSDLLKKADAEHQAVYVGALRESRSNVFYQRHGFEPVSTSEWDVQYRRLPQRETSAKA